MGGDLYEEDGEEAIATIVTEAIFLFAHGEIDEVTAGSLALLQLRPKKYANAIVFKDSMCNKKEIAKDQIIQELIARFPEFAWYTIFLPPRSPTEENPYAPPFLRHFLESRAYDQTIYVRFTQILGLYLPLRYYGWMINIQVELTDENAKSVEDNIEGALTVVVSTQPSRKHPGRTYTEIREDKAKCGQRRQFYQSAPFKISSLCEIASPAICDEKHARDYSLGL